MRFCFEPELQIGILNIFKRRSNEPSRPFGSLLEPFDTQKASHGPATTAKDVNKAVIEQIGTIGGAQSGPLCLFSPLKAS